jgi:spore maturation protein CgeB
VVIGINPTVAAAATNYASDRIWLSMLGGGFYIGQRTPGMDRLALDGTHCAWYEHLDDCVDKIRWYLDHPADRERIRQDGERFVRTHHTFDQRIRNILRNEPFVNPV